MMRCKLAQRGLYNVFSLKSSLGVVNTSALFSSIRRQAQTHPE